MLVHMKKEVIYQQYTATLGLVFLLRLVFLKVVVPFYCIVVDENLTAPRQIVKPLFFYLFLAIFCAMDCSFPAAGESPPLLPCFAEDEGKLCCTFSKLALATDFISTFGSADTALL